MVKASWREFDDPSILRPEKVKSPTGKEERNVRVQRTRGGKAGKTVTVISGLELEKTEGKSLLKSLKARCGTGGTLKGELLELQGDQVAVALEYLKQKGFHPKQSGG